MYSHIFSYPNGSTNDTKQPITMEALDKRINFRNDISFLLYPVKQAFIITKTPIIMIIAEKVATKNTSILFPPIKHPNFNFTIK